ncbi:hypothetical protein [Acinetobacter sp.]|uniref:hypothetical protein n=1 Tax=Acinetobacter sp. TaxID=472 RepID=UPI00389030A3
MTQTTEDIIFVIHTNKYSGSFERQLCAYITGQIGECDVGRELAELFKEELGEQEQGGIYDFESIIGSQPDDHGIYRPCEIWPTPGRWNDGHGKHFDLKEGDTGQHCPAYESVAIYFDEVPSMAMIKLMKERSYVYAKEHYMEPYFKDRTPLTITGFTLIRKTTKTVLTEVELPLE